MARTFLRDIRVTYKDDLQQRILKGIASGVSLEQVRSRHNLICNDFYEMNYECRIDMESEVNAIFAGGPASVLTRHTRSSLRPRTLPIGSTKRSSMLIASAGPLPEMSFGHQTSLQ
jgi:hypothetical protein